MRAEPTTRRAGAVVIGGDYRGLGIVRSLGRRGVPVWVLADEHSIAATSRYAHGSMPFPQVDEPAQVQFLLDLASRHGLSDWALIPTSDEHAALIARHEEALAERFRITTAPWDAMRWSYDKRLTYILAGTLGIDYPWTRWVTNVQELESLECRFPSILKPAFKQEINRFTYAKAWPVSDRQSLHTLFAEASKFVAPDELLIQELIPGGGEAQFSYAALCQDGRTIASLTARRTRQYPADFGRSSTFVETVERPEIEGPARLLISAMRHTGLIEIEFKQDPRDGSYKLLEANPRIWGWHTLGARAGVDFPYLLWQLINGESLPEVHAKPGVKWVRLVTDVLAVAHEMRKGRLSPLDYVRSLAGQLECAILSVDDPVPALLEVPLLCRVALMRRATV